MTTGQDPAQGAGVEGRREQSGAVARGLDRRSFFATGSSLAMAGGLAASYGTLLVMAGRYLYPVDRGRAWFFVADAPGIAAGASLSFSSPSGVAVTITRRADSRVDQEPLVEDFLALSSVCPHLGCRVHWEPHHERFFCPCHNGVFDPTGQPLSGPPAAAGQRLPQYPLQIVDGALYIEMPAATVGEDVGAGMRRV